jgi:hypothetical protein
VDWKNDYQADLNKYRELANSANNPFAGRMAPYFASIATAARLAHAALTLPWNYSDPIEPLWKQIVKEAGEANLGAAALRFVMDWAVAHQEDFYRTKVSTHQPPQGWAGRWDLSPPLPNKEPSWTMIGFMRHRLTELLKSNGFEPESIIRVWQANGWLQTSKEKDGTVRRTTRKRVGDENAHLICIQIKAAKGILSE